MATPNNPTTARVALRVQRDVRDFINTFHVTRADDGVITAADLVNIADAVALWWLNSYRTVLPSAIVGQDVTVTKQDPSDPLQYVAYLASAGTAGSGITPADVTAAVSWRSGLAGRKYRGRFYTFAIPPGVVNVNDTLTGGEIANLTAVGQYLLTTLTTAALKLIVFHRATNTKTNITSVIVDQLVDSMRTRLAGRGV